VTAAPAINLDEDGSATMKTLHKAIAISTLLIGLSATAAYAVPIAIGSAGGTYGQDFNTLATTGGIVSNVGANTWSLNGWGLYSFSGAAITTYAAGDGTSNAGGFYSFGNSMDRALGGLGSSGAYFNNGGTGPASGAMAGWFAVALSNNSGATLDGFSATFDGEQWRNGGNTSAQTMVLEYGFGSTFASVGTWSAAGAMFNFTSPVVGATAAAVDGNAAGRVAGLGGSILTNWNAGDTLWLRWAEVNDVGNDHALAIDNFNFVAGQQVSSVPLPAAAWLFGSGLLGLAGIGRRRRAV
jgi:hypothetical protein